MLYTAATLPAYAHLLSGILPYAGVTTSTRFPIPDLVTGRVDIDPAVQANIEEMLSPQTLQPYLDCRRRFSREELIREVEAINLAVRSDLKAYANSAFKGEHDISPLAPTGLGRHFLLVEQMHRNFAHFETPPKIGQFGIGIDPYSLLLACYPDIGMEARFRSLNLQAMGSSPETFELATVGNVTAYEWDAKVIETLRQNMREGIFYDNARSARWAHPRMQPDPTNPQGFDPVSLQMHAHWEAYVYKFVRSVASQRLGLQIERSGRFVEMGALLTFQSDIKDLIEIREADLITDSLWPPSLKAFAPPL